MQTRYSSSTLGTLYCVLSAVAYTAYNVCLREVSDLYNSAWINCVQASVGAGGFGALLAWQAFRGRRVLPPRKELLALAAIGLVTQIGGVLFIWRMAVIGVAVAATLQMGVMLAASAVLGQLILFERVSIRQVAAIALITASVVLFSRGAQPADENPMPAVAAGQQEHASSAQAVLGITAGALAGVAFAVLTVGIRKTVGATTSPEAIVFLINTAGVVFFGPWCLYRLGPHDLARTTPAHFGVMLAAGVMNLLAFLLVTKSLQRITVVRVNVVNNAVTMILTVIAGITLFAELWNAYLAMGMLLAAVGTVLISLQPSPGNADALAKTAELAGEYRDVLESSERAPWEAKHGTDSLSRQYR